ncbi:MAG: hypothetical protein IKZ98_00555 [Clostridia bacterium]|nr:hypothetical protein [Clostridia bacterium]
MNRNTKKEVLRCSALLLLLALISMFLVTGTSARADDYIIRKPKGDQLSEEEALKIASAFAHDVLKLSIEDLTPYYDNEHLFGPGDQWEADTKEDCWVISVSEKTIKTENEYIPSLAIIVNGTSGEVEYWEYRDMKSEATYINTLPAKSKFSVDEVFAIAEKELERALETAVQTPYIYRASILSENDGVPQWEVLLQFSDKDGEHYFNTDINADDGTIIHSELE